MTERCKPSMTLWMIVIASLMIFKTEGSRTSKQLYLTPYHLANGPVFPHLPYWTPYYYPMPMAYPSLYGQPFIDNTQFVVNQTGDVDSTSEKDENSKAMSRQRPFLTFLQNLFFGGPPTACPSCPSCPANKPCAPCAITAAATAVPATFTTCHPNGYSVASSGSIVLTGLTDITTVCEYFVAVQDPRAVARVQCSAFTLTGTGSGVWANSVSSLGSTSGASTVTAAADGTGVQIISSNFFGISIRNKLANGGSATCAWDVGSTTANSFTTCVLNGFSSANAGTITLTGLGTNANCLYAIGVQVPIANIRVTCATINLGTATLTTGIITVAPAPTGPTTTLEAGKPQAVIFNIAVIKVNNVAAGTAGAATCNWDLGPTISAFVDAQCTANAREFTTAATGTITLTNVPNARTCDFNIISPNNAATVTVKCTSKTLGTGDVTASFDDPTVTTTVTDTGVTSPLNYVTVRVLSGQAAGAVTCNWSTNLP